jgi:RimJ/RimL family protein N-acetyltransferase
MTTTVTIPTLETDRLILRAPRIEDFEGFAAFFASDRARYISEGLTARQDIWRLFGNMAGMWVLRGFGMFVFERKSDSQVIGHGGPWFPITHPEPELGWCLWQSADEGRGFAAEAIISARRFAYDDLGWTTAVSYIAPDNIGSIRLAERLGAVQDPAAPARPGASSLTWRHPAPGPKAGAA